MASAITEKALAFLLVLCLAASVLPMGVFATGAEAGTLDALKTAMLRGEDLRQNALTAAHADWAEEILRRREFTEENAESVLQEEVGAVFERVLEDAGVFKRDEAGRAAFRRFLQAADR